MWCPPQKRSYCPINKIGTQITTLELSKRLHILGVNHHLVAGICGNMFPEKTSLPAKQLETMENMKQTHIINIYTCRYIHIYIYYIYTNIHVCIYICTHPHFLPIFFGFNQKKSETHSTSLPPEAIPENGFTILQLETKNFQYFKLASGAGSASC